MNRIRKNLIRIITIGLLVFGIPIITLCSAYCSSSGYDRDFSQDANCSASTHSFDQLAIVLSALILLPFAGLLPGKDRLFITPGNYSPLFKPPRFSC